MIMVSQVRDDGRGMGGHPRGRDRRTSCLAGLSSVNAIDTIDRFVEMFQPHRQRQVRASLASALRGVVVQRLVPRAGGRGRVPAVEVLVVNGRVEERIADPARRHELAGEMAGGDLYGMQRFDQSLTQLYRDGLVTRADALEHADEPGELRFTLDRADFERGQAGADRHRVVPAAVGSSGSLTGDASARR